MLSPKIQDALNRQINAELFSSYLYLSMSAYFESKSLRGMANWMRIQAQEEDIHAMKFYDFVNDRGGRVVLTAIEAPKTSWDSPKQVFEETYAHECHVTSLINKLVDLSRTESDHAAETFLQWFVTEQVEEESNAETILDKLELVGDNGVALLMIDNELAQRIPPAPTTPAA